MLKHRSAKGLFTVLLACLLATGLCACAENGDDQTTAPSSGGESEITSEEGNKTDTPSDVYIHSFAELNSTEHALDSHKELYSSSYLEENFRDNCYFGGIQSRNTSPYYPRIKHLSDGRYMLIYHNGEYGGKVYAAFSDDITKFKSPMELFGEVKLDGETKYYMTPDAVEMPDGRIIAVCSYRSSTAYEKDISKNGIVIRYSDDGGKRWSEQQTVYVGTNWEPSLLSVEGKEVKLFFTSTAQTIEKYGFDNRYGVVGMLTSTDNGSTWTPNVTASPWAPQVVSQYYLGTENGMLKMTSQMPVAVKLNNGTTVLAVEEQRNEKTGDEITKKFSLGFSYSGAAFSDVSLAFGEDGPADSTRSAFSGAGPYIGQFPSGETVLAYHWAGKFKYRLGDSAAKAWRAETDLFDGVGHWGSVEIDGSHSAVMTVGKETNGIYITRLYLNHAITAQKLTPSLDGNGNDWTADEAWFLGSDSQAQSSVRFAHDNSKIYVLAERLDSFIESDDCITVILGDGTAEGFYSIKVAPDGSISATRYDPATKRHVKTDVSAQVTASVSACGTVSDVSDEDRGIVYEISIDKSLTNTADGALHINLSMQNRDKASAKLATDLLNGTDIGNKSTWIPVTLG